VRARTRQARVNLLATRSRSWCPFSLQFDPDARDLAVEREQPVGRIYQHTFIDTYSKVPFAKLYEHKTPLTAPT
jgi:hypothetical protein